MLADVTLQQIVQFAGDKCRVVECFFWGGGGANPGFVYGFECYN